MNKLLTPVGAGLYLRVHIRTIYRLVKNGKSPGRKFGARWKFEKDILDEWVSSKKDFPGERI
jgi:excisionase family DNA binding protein